MNRRKPSLAGRVAVFYALVAGAWIVGSTLLLAAQTHPPKLFVTMEMWKGIAFVSVTALLLYQYLRLRLFREAEALETARAVARDLHELRIIADHSDELLYKHGIDGVLTYASPSYRRILGLSAEDPLVKWTDMLTGNPLNQWALQMMQAALTTGEKQAPYLAEIHRKNGEVVVLEVNESPLMDAGGRVIGIVGTARDVTEREKAEAALEESEQALRESESRYRMLAEQVQDVIWEIDRNSQLTYVSPSISQMLGWTPADLIGKPVTSVLTEESADCIRNAFRLIVEDEKAGRTLSQTLTLFLDHHHQTGGIVPGEVRIRLIHDEFGYFAGMIGSTRDITERKETEQQIRRLNHIQALLSNINKTIVRTKNRDELLRESCLTAVEDGGFLMACVGWLDPKTGFATPVASAGDGEGYLESVRISIHPIDEGMGPSGVAMRENRAVVSANIAEDANFGTWRDLALASGFHSIASLPLTMHGKVCGFFSVHSGEPHFFTESEIQLLTEVANDLSFALDVLEREKQYAEEQQHIELLYTIIEATAAAIMITDRKGIIEWVNPAFTDLTGYSFAEAVGKNPRLLDSGKQSREFFQEMWNSITCGKVWRGELKNKRRDNSLYAEEMTITPVRSESGNIRHFIAIKQDITERKQLQEQFYRSQRMESIGLLAGGLAHDLNNVLTPILMSASMLRDEMPVEHRDEILNVIDASAQRGSGIIKQVLTFARGVEGERVQLSLRHLINEMVHIAKETFPRNITIRSGVPRDLSFMVGDPTQIHQVLLNLCVNARDAMPDGGTLTIEATDVEFTEPRTQLVFSVPAGKYVAISVKDTGTGISDEAMQHIFDPFFTTKPQGKGTGLGLSTVLGIVRSHTGLVDVQTKPGEGTKFTVYFPADNTVVETKVSSTNGADTRGHGETILIIDDEATILQVAERMLVANGYEVITARDGTEAISKFSANSGRVAAVITDIMMPVMDGALVTRAIREMDGKVNILACSGLLSTQEEDRISQMRSLGVRQFIHKPFTPDELLRALHEELQVVN